MLLLFRFPAILGKYFGMNLTLKRTPGIYLVGFMGCGKSTIGRVLAERLGWPFADLDDDIERREQEKISQIFASRGEAEFRRVETRALETRVRSVERGAPLVLALGGGAFAQEANRTMLSGRGISIWLDCPFDRLERRVRQASHRPLARDPKAFAELYTTRRAFYCQADVHVPVESDVPDPAVDAILQHPALR